MSFKIKTRFVNTVMVLLTLKLDNAQLPHMNFCNKSERLNNKFLIHIQLVEVTVHFKFSLINMSSDQE